MDIPIKLSSEDLDYIIEGVTERLAQAQKPERRKTQPAALCAFEAAITIGTKRLWPIAFLDDWLAQKQGCQVVPKLTRRRSDGQPS